MSTALLSSYKKDDALVSLARILSEFKWKILASAGTTKFLKENGIEAQDVAELVGPPILGHRVVTLSREIHAALLSSTPEDFKELERLHITPIDLVYVTLYPLEETIENAKSAPKDVIEKTDIGGPTLLSAGVKGGRIVLSSPEQIPTLESWFKKSSPESEREKMIEKFAVVALKRVADYSEKSAKYWEQRT